MKTCSRCKREQELDQFGRDKNRKDGLNLWCRTCKSETRKAYLASDQGQLNAKAYRHANKDHIRDLKQGWSERHREQENERLRLYALEHPERRKETCRRYREKNQAKIKAYGDWYREQNREACNARIAEWKKQNSLKTREYANRRNARKRGSQVDVVDYEAILERDGAWCYLCGDDIDAFLVYPDQLSLSFDHVVPIAKGGAHAEENIKPAHLGCNVKKGSTSLLCSPAP